MQNKSKIRKSIIRSFLALSLAVGTLMPPTILAYGDDPQEGGRGRQAPRVTCSTTTYNIIIATITVTECSDGSSSVSIS